MKISKKNIFQNKTISYLILNVKQSNRIIVLTNYCSKIVNLNSKFSKNDFWRILLAQFGYYYKWVSCDSIINFSGECEKGLCRNELVQTLAAEKRRNS